MSISKQNPNITYFQESLSKSKNRTKPEKNTLFYTWTMANKIIQWNIRSIKPNLNELLLLIGNVCPTVICLQETFLKEKDNITICNFTSYNYVNNNTDRAAGGTSILIHKKSPNEEYNLTQIFKLQLHQPHYIAP